MNEAETPIAALQRLRQQKEESRQGYMSRGSAKYAYEMEIAIQTLDEAITWLEVFSDA